MGWTTKKSGLIPCRGKRFLFPPQHPEKLLEAHQASSPVLLGSISLRVKSLGHEADHLSPPSDEGFFFCHSWGEVRLNLLGMLATSGPIGPALADDDEYRAVGGKKIGRGN
jgi:hypothetical protein